MTKYSKKTWKATVKCKQLEQYENSLQLSALTTTTGLFLDKAVCMCNFELNTNFCLPPPPQQKCTHTDNNKPPPTNPTPYHLHFPPQKDSCHYSFFDVIHLSCAPPPPPPTSSDLLIWLWLPVAASLLCHSTDLKETPEKDASWPKTSKMCKYFHWQALYGCSISIYATNTFLFQIWAPQGVAMSISPWPVKEQAEKGWLVM